MIFKYKYIDSEFFLLLPHATQEKPEPRILPHVEVCLGAGKRKMSVFE